MTLTVFSPLTPDIASSTLSRDHLREVEDDAGERLAELLRELLGHLLLGHAARPFVERAERREQLDVVEAGDVGAVVGAPELRDDR